MNSQVSIFDLFEPHYYWLTMSTPTRKIWKHHLHSQNACCCKHLNMLLVDYRIKECIEKKKSQRIQNDCESVAYKQQVIFYITYFSVRLLISYTFLNFWCNVWNLVYFHTPSTEHMFWSPSDHVRGEHKAKRITLLKIKRRFLLVEEGCLHNIFNGYFSKLHKQLKRIYYLWAFIDIQ